MVFVFKAPVRIRKTTTDTDNVSIKMLQAPYVSLEGTFSHMSSPILSNPDNFGKKINEKKQYLLPCYDAECLCA